MSDESNLAPQPGLYIPLTLSSRVLCFGAGIWEAINVLDAAYENNNEFQPRTLSIAVQDKAGVLNEVCACGCAQACKPAVIMLAYQTCT